MLKKGLIGLLVVLGVVGTVVYFQVYHFNYYTGKQEITRYEVLNDGQVAFEVDNSDKLVNATRKLFGKKKSHPGVHIGGNYIVLESVRLTGSNLSDDTGRGLGKYWYFTVYQLIDGKLESKKVDFLNIVKKNNLSVSLIGNRIVEYKGVPYIEVQIDFNLDKRFWLNLDTEEVETLSSDEVDNRLDILRANIPFKFASDIDVFDKYSYLSRDMVTLSLKKPMDSIELYNQSQEAYDIMLSQDSYFAIFGKPTLADSVQALQLFLPKGTNIFDNVTIPADYSIDGQEHVVNSFEEFQQYYKEGS